MEHFGLAAHLELVVGATLDGSRRAKADVVEVVLQTLDVSPGTAVMVGDRRQDVEGARVHGVPCLGVRWGYAEPGELEAVMPVALLADPAELVPAVADLARVRPLH